MLPNRLSGFPLWLEPAGSFTGEFSPNPSLPEKYDFEVQEGIFHEKIWRPISPDFEKKFYQSPDFYYQFQNVAKNVEGF